jgi:uncharacterized protein YsxB (DUF464 family)
MIKVKTNSSRVCISGHAFYDDYGKDIVCASVSSIVTTTVNAILMFDKDAIKYTVKEGFIDIILNKKDDMVEKLLANMINLLEELESEYPKNIKIERE